MKSTSVKVEAVGAADPIAPPRFWCAGRAALGSTCARPESGSNFASTTRRASLASLSTWSRDLRMKRAPSGWTSCRRYSTGWVLRLWSDPKVTCRVLWPGRRRRTMSESEDNVHRLRVTHDGGTPVGELAYSSAEDRWSFRYDHAWARQGAFQLSPAFPFEPPPAGYDSHAIRRFIVNLFPEGAPLRAALEQLHVAPSNAFALLREMGGDDRSTGVPALRSTTGCGRSSGTTLSVARGAQRPYRCCKGRRPHGVGRPGANVDCGLSGQAGRMGCARPRPRHGGQHVAAGAATGFDFHSQAAAGRPAHLTSRPTSTTA